MSGAGADAAIGGGSGQAGAGALAGRRALVLGANGGIGQAIARSLAADGARVVLAARHEQPLEALAAELRAAGCDATARAVDATDDAALAGLVASLAADGLDIAVNNLGTTHRPTPLADLPVTEIDRVMAVTFRAVAVAMTHELGVMTANEGAGHRRGGAIVTVASTSGQTGTPGMAAYAAAKHAVVGLSRAAARDYAAAGIRVSVVAPGPIESGPIMQQAPDARATAARTVPLGRMGGADEVAEAVRWLASDAASFTTGAVLRVDGGVLA